MDAPEGYLSVQNNKYRVGHRGFHEDLKRQLEREQNSYTRKYVKSV